jgi:hypothetical protein
MPLEGCIGLSQYELYHALQAQERRVRSQIDRLGAWNLPCGDADYFKQRAAAKETDGAGIDV